MNKLLRLLALFLALIMLLSACAGDGGKDDDDEDEDEDEDIVADKDKDEDKDNDKKPDNNKDPEDEDDKDNKPSKPDVEFQEVTFYDDNDVKLTALELTDFFDQMAYVIQVENNSDQDITVYMEYVCVNGYMPYGDSAGLYAPVEAGETVEEEFVLYSENLERCGIEVVADLEFTVRIVENENYEAIEEGAVCTLETGNEGYEQKIDDGGEVIMDEKGFRVIFQDCVEDDYYGLAQYFFFENNTNDMVWLDLENVMVNGCVAPYASSYVCLLPNTRTVSLLVLDEFAFVGIKDAGDIENIYFDLRILDAENDDYYEEEQICYAPGDANFVQDVDDSGNEIYNAEGIRVVVQEVLDEDDYSEILVYMENAYSEAISISLEVQKINGEDAWKYISVDLPEGAICVSSFTIWDDDLPGVEDADDLKNFEVILSIRTEESYDSIAYEKFTVELN